MKATIVLKDSMNRETKKLVEVNETVLLDAIGAIDDYLLDLAAVTDLAFVAAYISVDITPSLINGFAGAAVSNIDIGATFKVAPSGGGKAAHHIPGLPQTLAGTGGSVDVAQNELVAYFANFNGVANSLTLSDGETVSSVLEGKMDK